MIFQKILWDNHLQIWQELQEQPILKKNLDWVALPSKFYFGWLKKKSNSTGNQNQIDNLRVAFQPG